MVFSRHAEYTGGAAEAGPRARRGRPSQRSEACVSKRPARFPTTSAPRSARATAVTSLDVRDGLAGALWFDLVGPDPGDVLAYE